MTRVNVTGTNPTTRGIELVGWFDPDRATEYTENTEWDGNNNVSVATGSQWRHEMLYLTAGGRWVLHTWSRWQGDTPKYEFVDDERARQWLLLNNHDQSADEIAPVETERGPGRPEVGARVDVRLGELLPAVDTYAASHGLSRATAIRKLVAAGLVGGVPVMYRYTLTRIWESRRPLIAWGLLNPSTAGRAVNDPTVTKCGTFTRQWDYGGFMLFNLFGYRATHPEDLLTTPDPVGPDNDAQIRALLGDHRIHRVVCGWGNGNAAARLVNERAPAVLDLISTTGRVAECLGVNLNGTPKHPLYLPKGTQPVSYRDTRTVSRAVTP